MSQLYFSDITSDSLAVTWSAPAPPADTFKVHYSTDDSSEESEVVVDGSKTMTVLSGLLPSTKYIVSLVTIHGDSASEPVTGTIVTGTMWFSIGVTPNLVIYFIILMGCNLAIRVKMYQDKLYFFQPYSF